MSTKTRLKLILLAGCVCLFCTLQTGHGVETWRADFDAACAQSNDAMSLSTTELKKLIERCDNLQKIINAQDETVRKVFTKRLQLCKNLYVFVLEAKMLELEQKAK